MGLSVVDFVVVGAFVVVVVLIVVVFIVVVVLVVVVVLIEVVVIGGSVEHAPSPPNSFSFKQHELS